MKEKHIETVKMCRKTMMRLLEHMHSKRLLNCIHRTFTMPDGSETKVRHCDAASDILCEA